jgi:DNA/RNA-binding protein KIN17
VERTAAKAVQIKIRSNLVPNKKHSKRTTTLTFCYSRQSPTIHNIIDSPLVIYLRYPTQIQFKMGKAEKGTPKDIAKRIKMKGLQKLKFYCQMCEKQCRDANGFKCHLTSENHIRQMKIFSGNASGILDQYSKEFEKMYLSTLRMRHGTKRVNANNVYQEVIQDKQHIHMNATHWTTLTDFVQYLGKTGKCVVDEDERGWYVTYIERDASVLERQENMQRRLEAEKAAEEAQAQRMEIQRIEAAKALDRAGGKIHTEATKLERKDDNETIRVALNQSNPKSSAKTKVKRSSVFGDDDDDEEEEEEKAGGQRKGKGIHSMVTKPQLAPSSDKNRMKPMKSTDDEQQSKKYAAAKEDYPKPSKRQKSDPDRKDYWLYRDIIVRIVSKKLACGKYFKRKGIVDKVIDKYTAEVEVLDSAPDAKDGGDILRLDQDDLETVVGKEGKRVRVLNGPQRGKKATVESIDKKSYQATLKLETDGTILQAVPFEDFSKLA